MQLKLMLIELKKYWRFDKQCRFSFAIAIGAGSLLQFLAFKHKISKNTTNFNKSMIE